jgi:hypothetical protein
MAGVQCPDCRTFYALAGSSDEEGDPLLVLGPRHGITSTDRSTIYMTCEAWNDSTHWTDRMHLRQLDDITVVQPGLPGRGRLGRNKSHGPWDPKA